MCRAHRKWALRRNLGIRLHGLEAFGSRLPAATASKSPVPGSRVGRECHKRPLPSSTHLGLWFPVLAATSSFSEM